MAKYQSDIETGGNHWSQMNRLSAAILQSRTHVKHNTIQRR